MIVPNVEDLAQVLFAADGRTGWMNMGEPQGGFVREHYRKLAQTSIDWLTQTLSVPEVSVTATLTMIQPPPPAEAP